MCWGSRSGVTRIAGTAVEDLAPSGLPSWMVALLCGGLLLGISVAAGAQTARFAMTPAWSPDGRKIAYASGGGIYVMNPDGSGSHALTRNRDDAPTWSPNSRKLAFVRHTSEVGGNDRIYVINADGSHPQALTRSSVQSEWPSWSPDGRKIAFEDFRRSDNSGGVSVINLDGSNQHRLRANGSKPAWSPNGRKIAVGGDFIYVMDADGSRLHRLTKPLPPSSGTADDPAWSPDGSKIAFEGRNRDNSVSFIYVINADGSKPRRLTK